MSMSLTRMAGLVALCACVLGAACASSGAPGGDLDGGADDDGAIVDAGPDVLTFDADTTDAAPLKGFGEICTNKDECQSHICVFSGLTGVCSMVCGPPECPEGFGCYSVLGGIEPGQIAEICVPESDQLCSTCTDSSECATAAQDLCVTDADGLKWCARDCSAVSCPSGFDCEDVDVGGTTYRQCLPSSGACDCDASTSGATKPCVIPTPFGMCLGSKSCLGANGWATCAPPSTTDVPDGNFADENCDGIDGDVDEGIFVAPSGADSGSCGLTYLTPCLTVRHGVIRAVTVNRGAVYVQAGVYNDVVTMLNGIDIYGGYDLSWQRAGRGVPGHETRLIGALDAAEAQFMTLKAHNLIVPTIVADVVIEGPDATGTVGQNGRSSYAVHVKGTSGLTLERITIVAGDGAPGAAGGDGQNATNISATVGMAGGPGGAVKEFADLCDTTQHGAGGPAGTNSCPASTNPNAGAGGAGGEIDTSCFAGQCAVNGNCNATGGDAGGNASVFQVNVHGYRGGGGSGGNNNCLTVGPGGTGLPGRIANGAAGQKGSGSSLLSGTYWLADEGTAGTTGENGGGGGGGGGSGGCDTGEDSTGAGGSGGGAGGCRAMSGGGAGGGGGGSFGIFAVTSSVSVSDCSVQRGSAGTGGAGGTGGQGQSGGPPGIPGPAAADSAAGGSGGHGAHGGHGGGGGGGAGGISFGIYQLGSTIIQSCSFSGGAAGGGGAGGASAPSAPLSERDGNNGASGDPGTLGTVGVCASAGGC